MRKSVYIFVVLIGCVLLLFLVDRYPEMKTTYMQVVSRQGYTLKMIQQPVPIQLALKPEWLKENGTWNIKLLEKSNTSFILTRTELSNGGLTFTIAIRPKLGRSAGTFLSNKVYEEGGGYRYYAQAPLWKIYGHDGRQLDIDVIASGQGDRQFSFTLSKEDGKAFSASALLGLNVRYYGIVSYEYART